MTAERIDASQPEDALITRPDFDVCVRRLPLGGYIFATRLMAGCPLEDAAAEASASCISAGLIGAASSVMIFSLEEGV